MEPLAQAITTEMGKTLHEARLEAKACVEKVNITLNEGRRLVEGFVPTGVAGACHFLPLGVMAVIGPYNFPAHLANGHMTPALLAGNTVVFKPSSVTPLVGQIYAEAMAEFAGRRVQPAADLPAPGGPLDHASGRTGHPVHRIVCRGRRIKRLTLEDPWKILALEMGGKNCTMVCDDAHLPQALSEVMAAWLTTGQRCTRTPAGVIVHEKLAPELEPRVDECGRQVRGGNPTQAGTFMGPLASRAALKGYLASQDGVGNGIRTLVPSGRRSTASSRRRCTRSSSTMPTIPTSARRSSVPTSPSRPLVRSTKPSLAHPIRTTAWPSPSSLGSVRFSTR